jgi:hypothetical protein
MHAQILKGCPELEELTLRLSYSAGARWWHDVDPLLSAVVCLLGDRTARSDWTAGSVPWGWNLRNVRLEWVDPEVPAALWANVLDALLPACSVTVCAAAVQLEVPRPKVPVPAALRIVTQRLTLLRARKPAEFDRDLACLRARSQLTFEGVCLDAVRRCSEPLYRAQYGELPMSDYREEDWDDEWDDDVDSELEQ